jgi:hypothetical protein
MLFLPKKSMRRHTPFEAKFSHRHRELCLTPYRVLLVIVEWSSPKSVVYALARSMTKCRA